MNASPAGSPGQPVLPDTRGNAAGIIPMD